MKLGCRDSVGNPQVGVKVFAADSSSKSLNKCEGGRKKQKENTERCCCFSLLPFFIKSLVRGEWGSSSRPFIAVWIPSEWI